MHLLEENANYSICALVYMVLSIKILAFVDMEFAIFGRFGAFWVLI